MWLYDDPLTQEQNAHPLREMGMLRVKNRVLNGLHSRAFREPTGIGQGNWTEPQSDETGKFRVVARDGIEPPTPAFSGLRSTD